MSDLGIFIIAPVPAEVTPVAPWTYVADPVGGTGGWIQMRLTAGKTGGAGWEPGYIPRDGALPEIDLAVDLETGGDAEQLRTITLWIADQLADGQIMSTWLRANNVTLAGASVQLFAAAPIGGYPYPQPLWTGVIRQPRITLTRLGLPCESPLDSDPLGEIVSDSSIRPIVYGAASKTKLPALPIAEDVISNLVQGVAAPVEGVATPPNRAVLADSAAAGVILTHTNPTSMLSYVVLAYGLNVPDITPWFPGNVVPDTNDWYIEIVAGKGAGQVRRLSAGTSVLIYESGLAVPYPLLHVGAMADVRASEWTRSIQFQIDVPFTDIDSGDLLIQGTYKRAYPADYPENPYVDTWDGGEEISGGGGLYYEDISSTARLRDYYIPKADRSYARIIRKGRSFALPINSGFASASPLFVKQDSSFLQVNNAEDLFRLDGLTIYVIPSADSLDKARCFARLDPDWNFSKVLAEGVFDAPATSLQSQLPRIFGGDPGTDLYQNRFRIAPSSETGVGGEIPTWRINNHLTIALANSAWDLDGVEAIYLCAEMRWTRPDSDASDVIYPRMDLIASRSAPLESWWYPPFTSGHAWAYRNGLPETDPLNPLLIPAAGVYALQSIPPGLSLRPGPLYSWIRSAIKVAVANSLDKALTSLTIFIGAHRRGGDVNGLKYVGLELRQLMLLASRTVGLSEIYVDINGPTYGTNTPLTNWNKRITGDSLYGWPAVPLTEGVSSAAPIADHAHAVEDIFRRHAIAPWMVNPVDGALVEQAYVDLNSKTQISLSLLPAASRPRLAVAFTEAAPQVGDVVAQLCRDGMLVGSRNGRGQRTLKAWLARSLLTEFDAEILESELYRDSISEAPASALSKLVSAPLIRYGQQGGAPAYYVQVTRPDAATWQPEYTIGFQRTADAQRAWQICHRGWLESGVAQAREIRMDTIPDYDSLMALILAPRGNTFCDWISRPKRRLAPQVGLNHPAALLPRGSRIKLHHWRYAPGGAWGTLVRAKLSTQTQVATLELMMDLDP